MSENSTLHQGISRRTFLKTSAVAAGGAALAGSMTMTALAETYQIGQKAEEGEQLFHVVCHPNCFGYCRLNAHVRDGRLVKTSPVLWEGELADYRRICLRGLSHVQRIYDTQRVLHPLKRKSWAPDDYHPELRGKEEFEQIGWDEAVQYITDEWKKDIQQYGTASLAYWAGSGNTGNLNGILGFPARMATMLGMTSIANSVDSASAIGVNLVVGAGLDQPWPGNEPTDYKNSKALILWGNNVTDAQIQEWHFIYEAQQSGTKLICIDPIFTVAASKADWWIPVRPASDGALYHSIASVMFEENLIDEDFLINHTVAPFLVRRDTGKFLRMSDLSSGDSASADAENAQVDTQAGAGTDYAVWSADTKQPVLAGTINNPELFGTYEINGITADTALTLYRNMVDEFKPETAAEITGVPADDIRKLARICADGPVNHRLGYGPQAYNNGVHTIFAGISMCALTGNFGKPGAGFGSNWDMNLAGINFVDDYMHGSPIGTGASFSNLQLPEICRTGKLNGESFTLKSLLFFSGNPICCAVNTNVLLNDVLPVFNMVVTMDSEMTDTCRNSDFVLPTCHWFETSEVNQTGQAHMVEYSEKALEPLGESKSDADIVRLLMNAMDMGTIVAQTDEERIKAAIDTDWNKMMGITWDTLKEKKALRYSAFPHIAYANYGYGTASGRMEFYVENPSPAGTAVNGEPYDVEHQHLAWFEMPTEAWNEDAGVYKKNTLAEKYPIVLMSERPRYRVHGQWFNTGWLREIDPEPTVKMNPADAAARGISHGDYVEAYNDRGHAVAKVILSEAIRPGTAVYPKSWQMHQHKSGGWSAPCSSAYNMDGLNQSFMDNLVEIRPWNGEE